MCFGHPLLKGDPFIRERIDKLDEVACNYYYLPISSLPMVKISNESDKIFMGSAEGGAQSWLSKRK